MSNLSRQERRARERKKKKEERKLTKQKNASKRRLYFVGAAVLAAGLIGATMLISQMDKPVKEPTTKEFVKPDKQEETEVLSGIGNSKNLSLTVKKIKCIL